MLDIFFCVISPLIAEIRDHAGLGFSMIRVLTLSAANRRVLIGYSSIFQFQGKGFEDLLFLAAQFFFHFSSPGHFTNLTTNLPLKHIHHLLHSTNHPIWVKRRLTSTCMCPFPS
jgi:hypothetical protein